MFLVLFVFFSSRRRHTRLQGDWSSDVCSSDLRSPLAAWTSPATGPRPSAQFVWEQKLYSVVSVPLGVILKTVPPLLIPPPAVVPSRSPLAAWTSPATGSSPSAQFVWEQKLYSVVSVPLGVILKTVPPLLAPPSPVVP